MDDDPAFTNNGGMGGTEGRVKFINRYMEIFCPCAGAMGEKRPRIGVVELASQPRHMFRSCWVEPRGGEDCGGELD